MSTVFPKFTEKSLELWVGIGKVWLGISSHMYLPCNTHPAPYMLKKTHIHLSTYKRTWPRVNFTFRVIQTLFFHLTKGRFCFTSDKQTAFKESYPIRIWYIQLWRSAQSIWNIERSWNWHSVEWHWAMCTLKRNDSEPCWKKWLHHIWFTIYVSL